MSKAVHSKWRHSVRLGPDRPLGGRPRSYPNRRTGRNELGGSGCGATAISSDNFYPGFFPVLRRQRRKTLVTSGQPTALVDCQPKEIGIGYLLMAAQSSMGHVQRFAQGNVSGPEMVSRMTQIPFSNETAFPGLRASGENAGLQSIRTNADWVNGARSPAMFRVPAKPSGYSFVQHVNRPRQCYEGIDV